MSYKVIFRKAVPSDIIHMIGLLKSLFEIETDFNFDSTTQQQGLKMMLADESNRCIIVAEINNQVIGMCSAQLIVSTAEGGLKAIIEDLVVAEGYRSQGIGKLLLSAIEEWAYNKRAKRLDLLADRRNHQALKFYEKFNWRYTELICLQKFPGNLAIDL